MSEETHYFLKCTSITDRLMLEKPGYFFQKIFKCPVL